MNIASFIDKIKTQSLDDYLRYLINVYVDNTVEMDSMDGANLRELFRKDPSSFGDFNHEDYSNFFNKKLVADLMIRKDLYTSYMNEQDRDVKTNMYSNVAREIVTAITPFQGYVVLDSSRLKESMPQVDLEHEFTLNVNAADAVKVLRSIYETASNNNIDFFITIPNVVEDIEGTNDFISIICETRNLENTLRLLELIPSDIKQLCKTPCPFGGIIDGWVGYSSVENNHAISSVIGRSIIQGIDNSINEFATIQPDMVQYVEALNNGVDKDQIRVQALKIMREINPDKYNAVVEHIKKMLITNNIDLDHLFLSKEIMAKLGVSAPANTNELQPTSDKVEETFKAAEEGKISQSQIEKMLEESSMPGSNGVLSKEQIEQMLMGNTSEATDFLGESSKDAPKNPIVHPSPTIDGAITNMNPEALSAIINPAQAAADAIIAQGGEAQTTPLNKDKKTAFDETLSDWTDDNVQGVSEISVSDPFVSVPQANEVGGVTAAISEQAQPQVEISDANKAVYTQIGLTEDMLNTKVIDQNNNEVTLYQFLESNETLKKVPLEANVTLIADVNNAEANQVITGSQFIVNTIVTYATRIGKTSVDEIIRLYTSSIKIDDNKKKSLFGGIFKKK